MSRMLAHSETEGALFLTALRIHGGRLWIVESMGKIFARTGRAAAIRAFQNYGMAATISATALDVEGEVRSTRMLSGVACSP